MEHVFGQTMRLEKTSQQGTTYPVSLSRFRDVAYGGKDGVYTGRPTEEYEIYICREGTGTLCVGDNTYTVESGTIMTYRPDEEHVVYTTKLEPYDRYILLLYPSIIANLWDGADTSLLSLFNARERYQRNEIRLPPHEFKRLLALLDKAVSYNEDPGLGADALFFGDVLKILQIVNHGFLEMEKQQYAVHQFPVVNEALKLIDEQFTTLQSVEDLSAQLHISTSYLARVFKRQVGTSVYDYIQNLKFAHSANLLASGSSVTQACYDAGFNSYSHFIQMFKRKYGMTPRKYQKNLEV